MHDKNEMRLRIQELRYEIRVTLALLNEAERTARLRSRNLVLGAVTFAGGLILGPISGFLSFGITLLGGGLLANEIVEDNAASLQMLIARKKLGQLEQELYQLEHDIKRLP